MITAEEIQTDIRGFQEQIRKAQTALVRLPSGRLPYPDHKKREARGKELQEDILHVNRLISCAKEGL
jgi:hypothetical protein